MSIRRAGPGVLSRHLLNSSNGKAFCERTLDRGASDSIFQHSHIQSQREIHTSRTVTDARYLRYFWPTRPDFLPSKQVDQRKEKAPIRAEKVQDSLTRAREFLPMHDMKIQIPSPYDVPESNRDLCLALHSGQDWEVVRSLFQDHVKDVTQNEATPMDSMTFDACFWTVASVEEIHGSQLENIFLTLKEMRNYAITNTEYDLTRLQLHRLIRIWTSIWSRQDLIDGDLRHIEFLQIVYEYISHLDGDLATHIVKFQMKVCNSTSRLRVILDFIKGYKNVNEIESRPALRLESWSSSSEASAVYDSDLYYGKADERKFRPWIMSSILKFTKNLEASEEVLDAIMEAVDESEDDVSPQSLVKSLSLFDKTTLYNLLPANIQQEASDIDIDDEFKPAKAAISFDSPCSKDKIEKMSRSCSSRLAHALAATLAQKEYGSDYRPGLCLFKSSSVKTSDEQNEFETHTYAATALACAHHALDNGEVNSAFLQHLQQAISIFVNNRWNNLDSGDEVALAIISVFHKLFVNSKSPTVKSEEQNRCIKLLQQFCTALLANDSELDVLKSQKYNLFNHRKRPILVLLHLLVKQREYAFARRFYIMASRHDQVDLAFQPILNEADFLWLFQASMKIETNIQFSELLFTHWESIQQNQSATPWLTTFPSSLLRMYFDKLTASGKIHRINSLKRYLELDLNSSFALNIKNDSRITARHNAIRTCRVAFGSGRGQVEEALNIVFVVIQRWQEEREKGHEELSTLIHLYSIALDKSTIWLDQSSSLFQAKILSVFKSFREYFNFLDESKGHEGKFKGLKIFRKPVVQRNLHVIYRCALKVLVRQKKENEVQEQVESILKELTIRWKQTIGADIYGHCLEAYLIGKPEDQNLDRAVELLQAGIKEAEIEKEIFPATSTARLIKALTRNFDFSRSERVFQMYKKHTVGLPRSSIVMVEAAGIELAFRQGRRLEAAWRVEDLIKEVQDVDRIPAKVNWLRSLRQVSQILKAQDLDSQSVQEPALSSPTTTITSRDHQSEEEKERLNAFGAMAGGQPFKWKWHRNRLFPSNSTNS